MRLFSKPLPPPHEAKGFSRKLLETINPMMKYEDFQKRLAGPDSAGWKKLLMSSHPCFSYTDLNSRAKYIEDKSVFIDYVLDCFHYPLYMIDVNYNLLYANKAALELWGIEALPAGAKCHQLTHKSDKPCGEESHPCTLREVMRTNSRVVHEHIHHGKDGAPMFIEVHGHPVYGEDGKLKALLEFSVDITKQKLEQQERKKRNAMISALSSRAAEGILAGGMRHDLNNALFAVIGNGQLNTRTVAEMDALIAEGRLASPEFLRHFGTLKYQIETQNEGAENCRSRVGRLSIFSESTPKAVANVPEVVETSVVLLESLFADARMAGKMFSVNVDKKSPKCFARVNPRALNAAFTNIVKNAVEEFGTERRHKIEIKWGLEQGAAGDFVSLRIGNDGPPIPDYLFKKLLKDTVQSSKDGQGIGLATSAMTLREYGGSLSYTTSESWTEFEILLEASREEIEPSRAKPQEIGKGLKIAVLDDEELVNLTLKAMLADQKCTIFEDAQNALHVLSTGNFDALIVDVSMPGAYGPRFAQKVRSARPNTAIIVLTGHSALPINGEFKGAVDMVLEKPVSEQALRSALAEAIEKRKAAAAAAGTK